MINKIVSKDEIESGRHLANLVRPKKPVATIPKEKVGFFKGFAKRAEFHGYSNVEIDNIVKLAVRAGLGGVPAQQLARPQGPRPTPAILKPKAPVQSSPLDHQLTPNPLMNGNFVNSQKMLGLPIMQPAGASLGAASVQPNGPQGMSSLKPYRGN